MVIRGKKQAQILPDCARVGMSAPDHSPDRPSVEPRRLSSDPRNIQSEGKGGTGILRDHPGKHASPDTRRRHPRYISSQHHPVKEKSTQEKIEHSKRKRNDKLLIHEQVYTYIMQSWPTKTSSGLNTKNAQHSDENRNTHAGSHQRQKEICQVIISVSQSFRFMWYQQQAPPGTETRRHPPLGLSPPGAESNQSVGSTTGLMPIQLE